MSSNTSTASSTPFRLFNSKKTVAMALGRAHASWFIIYSRPYAMRMLREDQCVNFIVPGDSSTVSPYFSSPGTKPRFTIGGRVVRRYASTSKEAETLNLRAIVEVDVPPEELAYACARCGMWETMRGPRFLRCGGCKSRYYCSKECQKDDWKRAFHKGECGLLKEGKGYEAESRRGLHNNGWWFDNNMFGDTYLSSGTGEIEVERAEDEGDYIYLAYGRRSLPRDVPPSTRPPLPRVDAPLGPDGRPPGFVSTGDAFHDKLVIDQYRLFYLDPSRAQRSAPPKPIPPIPPFPALPAVPGFTPTGDPALDEPALFLHVSEHGTPAQLEEVKAVIDARHEMHEKRAELATALAALTIRKRDEVTRAFEAMPVPPGMEGYGSYPEDSDEDFDGSSEDLDESSENND